MARYSRYEEVARLAGEEMEALLSGGDPPERVWAAWALGLHRGAAFVPDLAATVAVEPSAGARRHLAVVLAGFGERWLLTVLATGDPDAGVRETASRHLARLATPPHDTEIYPLLLGRLRHDAPGVRAAIVRSLPADVPSPLREAAAAALSDPDLEVREAAFSRLLARVAAGEPLSPLAMERALEEPDRFLRKQLLALLPGRLDEVPRSFRLELLLTLQLQVLGDPELERLENTLTEHLCGDLAGASARALSGEELDLAIRLRAVLETRNSSWVLCDGSEPRLPVPLEPRSRPERLGSDGGAGWGLLSVLRAVT